MPNEAQRAVDASASFRRKEMRDEDDGFHDWLQDFLARTIVV